jgi:hypothetical protein
MAGHGEKFGRKQEDAIAALLTQRNVEEAARAAGIGARTLLRWLKLPEFQDAYRQARREAFSQSIARLQQGTSAAATTLLKVMIDPNAPASVRVRAAGGAPVRTGAGHRSIQANEKELIGGEAHVARHEAQAGDVGAFY